MDKDPRKSLVCVDTAVLRQSELHDQKPAVQYTAWLFDRAAASLLEEARGSSADRAIPEIEGFVDLEEIGNGAMGIVYSAWEDRLNRRVALKLMSPSYLRRASNPAKEQQRFTDEAQRAASLHHSNIVPIFGAGVCKDGATPYFAMQLVCGKSLDIICAQLIRERAGDKSTGLILPQDITRSLTEPGFTPPGCEWPAFERSIVRMTRDLAAALDCAHRHNILHRDIKPANIMIDSAGHCWIADFGLAQDLSESVDACMNLSGSLPYMAPERFSGKASVRSDIYALGITIYELLTRQRVTRLPTVSHGQRQTVLSPSEAEPRVSRDFDAVLQKAFAVDAHSRYASAADLSADCERILSGVETAARPLTRVQRVCRDWQRNWWKPLSLLLLAVVLVMSGQQLSSRLTALQSSENKAKEERDEAQAAALRAAEIYQCLAQQQLAANYMRENKPGEAFKALSGVPASQLTWETRFRLGQLSAAKPERVRVMAQGHWGILAAAASPSRKRMLVADAAGVFALWNVETGKIEKVLNPGRFSARFLGTMHHYVDQSSQKPVVEWGDCVTDIAWLGNTSDVVTVSLNGTASKVTMPSGASQTLLRTDKPLTAVAASANGDSTSILIGDTEGVLYAGDNRDESFKIVESDSAEAATSIVAVNRHWVVGRSDGSVELINADTLATASARKLDASIRAIGVVQQAERSLIFVASDSPHVRIFEISAAGVLRGTGEFESPEPVHALQASLDGKTIYAIDRTGAMSQWQISDQKQLWSVRAITPDPKISQVRAVKPADVTMPQRFDSVGTELIPLADHRLLAFGQDATIHEWSTAKVDAASERDSDLRCGPSPQVVFDQVRDVLWALDADGTLWCIRADSETVVAQRNAHPGGGTGIAAVGRTGQIVTTGNDHRLKFWTLVEGRIQPVGVEEIRHDACLLSVTVSGDSKMVACVDEQAFLSVWSAADGKQLYLKRLPGDGSQLNPADAEAGLAPPLIGALAFNTDSTFLAALGAGQSGAIFECDPQRRTFQRHPSQLYIAGMGGTAVIWNPFYDDFVIAADDYPRYKCLSLSGEQRHLDSRRPVSSNKCVAMTTTPDKKRLVFGEVDGLLRFVEVEQQIEMLQMDSGLNNLVDLAFDRRGDLLAVSDHEGAIRMLRAESPVEKKSLEAEDRTGSWKVKRLVAPTRSELRLDPRAIRMDGQGRLCLAYVESTKRDERDEGQLVFLREDGLPEPILSDSPRFHRRHAIRGVDLQITGDDQPILVFNQRTARESPYDRMHRIGYRQGPRDWTFETISESGNDGFYPVTRLNADGTVAEVIHFSFAGFYLMQSIHTEEWQTSRIGFQGDGLNLRGFAAGDHVHLHFKPNRNNGDPLPYRYAFWDGAELHSDAKYEVKTVTRTADGGVAMVVRFENGTAAVLIREGEDWNTYSRLPDGLTGDACQSVTVALDGSVRWLSWDESASGLMLTQGHENDWHRSIIYRGVGDDRPNFWRLCTDREGSPMVLIARQNEPFGWVDALRPVQSSAN